MVLSRDSLPVRSAQPTSRCRNSCARRQKLLKYVCQVLLLCASECCLLGCEAAAGAVAAIPQGLVCGVCQQCGHA